MKRVVWVVSAIVAVSAPLLAGGHEKPAAKVEKLAAQKTSIMPEQLLRDLTAEQAADLLEFLASLK